MVAGRSGASGGGVRSARLPAHDSGLAPAVTPLAPLRPATIDGHLHGAVIKRRVGAAVVLVDVTVAVVVESVAPPGRRRRDARLKGAKI